MSSALAGSLPPGKPSTFCLKEHSVCIFVHPAFFLLNILEITPHKYIEKFLFCLQVYGIPFCECIPLFNQTVPIKENSSEFQRVLSLTVLL